MMRAAKLEDEGSTRVAADIRLGIQEITRLSAALANGTRERMSATHGRERAQDIANKTAVTVKVKSRYANGGKWARG